MAKTLQLPGNQSDKKLLFLFLGSGYIRKLNLQFKFGTQVESHRSSDHNSLAAVSGFSAPWYFSEMELEPVAG